MIGIGPILSEAIEAAKKTLENGKSTCVISMGSIKPLDDVMNIIIQFVDYNLLLINYT